MRAWLFITLLTNVASIFAQDCVTPNGVWAKCILLDNCDPVSQFLDSHKTLAMSFAQRQYINLLPCWEDEYGRPIVCCAPNDPFFAENAATITMKPIKFTVATVAARVSATNSLPDPHNSKCGSDVLANRIYGGTAAELGQFPWMALLQYQHSKTREKSFSCGGSLINERFVLTAGHCTTGDVIQKKGKLISVRLGEHNLNTTVDCEVYEDGEEVCAPPAIDVPVEYAIAHPNYVNIGIVPYNDIGLIRLVYDIQPTLYIEPICFPPLDLNSSVGMGLTVSGWGRTGDESPRSDIKQKVTLPVIEFKRCLDSFFPVKIDSSTQICAGAEKGKDSCNGDSGGPLMVFFNGIWYVEGLVSFGLNTCGLDGISGVYTRVNSYTDWIISVIG